jgi:hypothetical protein
MHASGLLLFVLAAPLALIGLCDPNARRGGIIMIAATLMAPLGLVLAAA